MNYHRFMHDGTQTEAKFRDGELNKRLVAFNANWNGGVAMPLSIAFWAARAIWLAFVGRGGHIHAGLRVGYSVWKLVDVLQAATSGIWAAINIGEP